MNEIFTSAKDGNTICSVNGIQLHSVYNPIKEAERFTNSLEISFTPTYIIITGSALSYCAPFFRMKFPSAKIGTIHYSPAFFQTNSLWDFVLVYNENTKLQNDLYSIIGEEDSGSVFFASWKPSEAAYPQEYTETWSQIKKFLSMARDVLGTRMYFNKRWLKNTLRFCLYTQNICIPRSPITQLPIVIAASGPTLEKMLPILAQHHEKFYLFAVSSAITPLVSHGINPDFCISTDGGFWAKEHLKSFSRNHDLLSPLLVSAESAVPYQLISSQNTVPLTYRDGVESLLLDICQLPSVSAERNGTVSGTAAQLALNLTTGEVFCIGLDLASVKGYQHCKTNELELNNSRFDSRLMPLSQHTIPAELSSGSLSVYSDWFSTRKSIFYNRFHRVAHSSDSFTTHLTNITELTHTEFLERLPEPKNKSKLFTPRTLLSSEQRVFLVSNYLCSIQQKIQCARDQGILVKKLDPELVLWLKAISLGDFLTAKKNNQPVTSIMQEKFQELILFFKRITTHHGESNCL